MADASVETSVIEVRRRTKASQHVASFPLLVMGVLFVNYGVVSFAGQPVAWRYAGALAFVVLWGLGKVNESEVGVGPARGDFLAIAAGVFTATQLTLIDHFVNWLGFERLQGVWVVIIGGGLLALGFSRHEGALVAWGAFVGAAGIALLIADYSGSTSFVGGGNVIALSSQSAPVALLGVVLTVAGLVTYERERRIA
jgi:hypothetical protein